MTIYKYIFLGMGGFIGWLVAEFRPTFPLAIVAIAFVLYDAYTAYQLDKRVHEVYPDKTDRKKAYFTSFAFGKVIKKTIPERLVLILLAYMAERWVFVHVAIPLSYMVTGAILFEQAWSALENNSSCRSERDSRMWRIMQRIMVDKTERHFRIDLSELKEDDAITDEQVRRAREILLRYERDKK
jgi:hypothetical protein